MSKPAENIEFLNLVVKKLTGEASAQETELLESYLAEDPAYERIYKEYEQIWDGSADVKPYTKDEIDAEWNKLDQNLEQPAKRLSRPFMLRVAAAFAILFIAGLSFIVIDQYFGPNQFVAETEIKETNLEDGTSVTLNAQSVLKYTKQFNKEVRYVELSGEAYFDVAEDTTKPFVIHTGEIEIQVLGTSFNVQAYQDKPNVEVVVASGLVSVTKRGDPDEKIILKPGHKGIYNRESGTLTLQENEDVNYLSWKTKSFEFDDTSLEVVIEKLNNAYHKNISLEYEDAGNCPITVSFNELSLDAILKILESTLNLQMQETEDGIVLKGSGC